MDFFGNRKMQIFIKHNGNKMIVRQESRVYSKYRDLTNNPYRMVVCTNGDNMCIAGQVLTGVYLITVWEAEINFRFSYHRRIFFVHYQLQLS